MNRIMIESGSRTLVSDKMNTLTATSKHVNVSQSNISEESRHILNSFYVNPRKDKNLICGDRNQIVVVGMEIDLEGIGGHFLV